MPLSAPPHTHHTHLADPYAIVSFGRYSHTTRIMKQTVCPTWDQTIILDDILLFGNPDTILQSPPMCMVEFYDRDQIVSRSYDTYVNISYAHTCMCMHSFTFFLTAY